MPQTLLVFLTLLALRRPLLALTGALVKGPLRRGPVAALVTALTTTLCMAAWEWFKEKAHATAPRVAHAAERMDAAFYLSVTERGESGPDRPPVDPAEAANLEVSAAANT